jgi:hypothetical protein
MRRFILPFIILCPFLSFAQHYEEQDKNHVSRIVSVDLGLTGVQIGAELVVGKNQTVLLRSGIAPVLYNHDPYFDDSITLTAAFNASIEYRIYYNFSKRIDAGKEVQNNGANYFAFHASILRYPLGNKSTEHYNRNGALIFGPLWGFNRPMGNRIAFNFNIGPAIINETRRRVTGFTIWGDARFLIKLHK